MKKYSKSEVAVFIALLESEEYAKSVAEKFDVDLEKIKKIKNSPMSLPEAGKLFPYTGKWVSINSDKLSVFAYDDGGCCVEYDDGLESKYFYFDDEKLFLGENK